MPAVKSEAVKIYRENTSWKKIFATAIGLIILLTAIGLLNGSSASQWNWPWTKAPIPYLGNLPEHFDEEKLPRQIGYWRLKLNPNKFSGKVILPENIGFTLRWQTSQLVQVRNGYGEILTTDPRIQNHLGKHEGNLVLQFKGHGAVLIVITECL